MYVGTHPDWLKYFIFLARNEPTSQQFETRLLLKKRKKLTCSNSKRKKKSRKKETLISINKKTNKQTLVTDNFATLAQEDKSSQVALQNN